MEDGVAPRDRLACPPSWTEALSGPFPPASVLGGLARLWFPWGMGRVRALQLLQECPQLALYGPEAARPEGI